MRISKASAEEAFVRDLEGPRIEVAEHDRRAVEVLKQLPQLASATLKLGASPVRWRDGSGINLGWNNGIESTTTIAPVIASIG